MTGVLTADIYCSPAIIGRYVVLQVKSQGLALNIAEIEVYEKLPGR